MAKARLRKQPPLWAIRVSGDWFEGATWMHDGDKPWLFGTEAAAKAKADECAEYRRERDFPPAVYEPVSVRLAPLKRPRAAE